MQFQISKETFIIDGQPQPLLCGEIHYYRMAESAWEPALDLLCQAGCNGVAFYIPWFVHEYQEGCFDFSGQRCPQSNLHGFIRLATKKNLLILFRPGPYIYAETRDLGIPVWFSEHYPDAHPVEYKDGQYVRYGMKNYASHCHPDFLKRVDVWLKAVMKEVQEYLAPAGNIVMIQLCNEIPGEDHQDENPKVLGLGDEKGLWPSFLKDRYDNASDLQAAYGIEQLDILLCPPHLLRLANPAKYEADKLAYYYEWYYPAYFAKLKDMLGDLPSEIVLFHNAYNPKALSLHSHNQKKNPWLNIGVDCYYSMTGSLNLQAATYFNDFGAAYSRALINNPPWVVEQECGYWHDFPIVYGPELYIWNVWSFAAGYRGANLYLFSGGENLPGMGFFGTSHHWQAPVTKDGIPGRTYPYIAKAMADIKEYFPLFCSPDSHDIVLAVPGQAGLIWTATANVVRDTFFLLRALGFSPRIVDLDHCDLADLKTGMPVWAISNGSMSGRVQDILSRYLLEGGSLVLSGMLPWEDENNQPCQRLANQLGLIPKSSAWQPAEQQKILWQAREVFLGQAVQPIEGPSGAVLAVLEDQETAAVWHISGENNALVLPFPIEMIFDDQATCIGQMLEVLNIHSHVKGANLLRVFPKADGQALIFNLHPERINESITIKGKLHNVTLEAYSFLLIGG